MKHEMARALPLVMLVAVGGGSDSFPKTVKLQGTIELSNRTYDPAGDKVVIERTSKGTFSGTSTASDLRSV